MQSHIAALHDRAVCQKIVAAHNGGTALTDQPGKMLCHALGYKIGNTCQSFVMGKSAFFQCLEKGVITLLVNKRPQCAAQVADFLMAQPFQIIHTQAHTLAVAHPHIGHVWVSNNHVVIENSGRFAGLKVF